MRHFVTILVLMLSSFSGYSFDKFDIEVCEANKDNTAKILCYRNLDIVHNCQSESIDDELICYRNSVNSKKEDIPIINNTNIMDKASTILSKGVYDDFGKDMEQSPYETRIIVWANQFNRSESWVRTHTLPTDDFQQANNKLAMATLKEESIAGQIDFQLVEKLKLAWQEGGLKYQPKSEQIKALITMQTSVRTKIQNSADIESTLDYIENHISEW